jgi:hypothetical protein
LKKASIEKSVWIILANYQKSLKSRKKLRLNIDLYFFKLHEHLGSYDSSFIKRLKAKKIFDKFEQNISRCEDHTVLSETFAIGDLTIKIYPPKNKTNEHLARITIYLKHNEVADFNIVKSWGYTNTNFDYIHLKNKQVELNKFKKDEWYFDKLIPLIENLEDNYKKYVEEKDERRRQSLIDSIV